jgi:hypothetical protein
VSDLDHILQAVSDLGREVSTLAARAESKVVS